MQDQSFMSSASAGTSRIQASMISSGTDPAKINQLFEKIGIPMKFNLIQKNVITLKQKRGLLKIFYKS